MKQRVWLGLFGLVFGLAFGAGAWFGGWSTLLKTASAWQQTRDWQPVQAKVTQAELREHRNSDNGTTYNVDTRYVYNYAGREYQARRVGLLSGGSDNFDDWHQRWYQTLRDARDQDGSIEAWIDPEHPERAILDRQVRVPALMFALPFSIGFTLFSVLGWFLLWYAIRKPAPVEDKQALVNASRIQRSSSGAWGGIVFGAIFLSIGLPAAYFVSLSYRTLHPVWFVYLFPLIGGWMVYMGLKSMREARRIGQVALQLTDLHPVLGERMRGVIEFEGQPAALPLARPCALRLYCERVDSSGEDTSYTRLWVKELEVRPVGKRLPFSFDLPADVPPSEPDAKIFHRWQLQLNSDDLAEAIDFDLVVFAAEKSAGEAAPADVMPEIQHTESAARAEPVRHHDEPIPARVATVTTGFKRLCIDYNPALYRSFTWICGVMGMVFSGVAFYLVSSLTLFFGMIFGFFAATLFYIALRCVWVRRRVTVEAGKLSVEEANLFGKKVRVFPTEDIVRLVPTVGYSTGKGSGQTDHHTLNAITRSGEYFSVGGGIASPRVVESLLHLLRRALGEQVTVAGVERTRDNLLELAQLNTQPRRNVRQLFMGVTIVGVVLSFGAFALDFYKDFSGRNDRPASISAAPDARIAATADAWFTAMDANRLDDMKAIAALGFDINMQADNGSSALALAASKGRLDIAQWLIDSGADIHQRNAQKKNDNYLTTPLMRAGFGANPALVSLLLEKGADIHAQDQFKRTPLHFMAWGGCGECIRMLVKKGADLEAHATGNRGETPLMSAAGGGHVEGVRTLLELGAYAKAQDNYGYTALGWAQFHQHPKVIEFLESAP